MNGHHATVGNGENGHCCHGKELNGHAAVENGPRDECLLAKHSNGHPVSWRIKPSRSARSTMNPIRQIVDVMKLLPNPQKDVIRLTIGDPTIYNLLPAKICTDAVHSAIDSAKYHGYPSSVGYPEGRAAVAQYFNHPQAPLTADDVILTSGCSQALQILIELLVEPGQNILIPRPGFSLYKVICGNKGLQYKYYDLLPEKRWEVDLTHLESQIDEHTVAIITNTPSNPCGSVYSRKHIEDILAVAEKYKLPIISDEVYERVVFDGEEHVPFGVVAAGMGSVPVFTVGAVSKRFLCPGWRMGWLIVYDHGSVLDPALRKALVSLTQVILGPCSLLQGALPQMLTHDVDHQLDACNKLYEKNAKVVFKTLSASPGLHPIMPSGAMYMMVGVDMPKFPEVSTSIEFTEKLMAEESVFCLPADCFDFPGYFRLVLAVHEDMVIEACSRIQAFCVRHYQPASSAGALEDSGSDGPSE